MRWHRVVAIAALLGGCGRWGFWRALAQGEEGASGQRRSIAGDFAKAGICTMRAQNRTVSSWTNVVQVDVQDGLPSP